MGSSRASALDPSVWGRKKDRQLVLSYRPSFHPWETTCPPGNSPGLDRGYHLPVAPYRVLKVMGNDIHTGTCLSPSRAGVNSMASATLSAASSKARCPLLSLIRVRWVTPSSSRKNQTVTVPPMPASRRRGG